VCGRYTLAHVDRLAKAFPRYRFPALVARFNVAPTQTILVKRDDGTSEVVAMQWGLVPPWAKDPAVGSRMINARAETVVEKPSFRNALAHRRALIFADGFYEWRTGPRGREPVYFTLASGEPFVFAGLWEQWWGAPEHAREQPLETAAVITVPPNALVARVHDRMPAILTGAACERWLDHRTPVTQALHELRSYLPELMTATPVSRRVNRAGYDVPDCIVPENDESPTAGRALETLPLPFGEN
jgi:putative SOS response-associated peptidase YedK